MVTLALTALTRENRLLPAVRKLIRAAASAIRAGARSAGGILAGIDEARAMAARYDALSRLSDAELSQRGLARSDIPLVVLEGTALR